MTTITNSALTRGFRTTNFFRTGSRPSFSSQYSFAFDLAIGYSVSWHRSYKCFNTNNNSQGFDDCFTTRCNVLQKRIRATPEHSGSTSEPLETPCDHPCEDIENMVAKNKNDLHLSNAQITRTIIEIHNKATLMFSAVIHDDDENIFWPDVPYITDDHGGIYFKVNEDEDILQVLTTESQYVQVLIGFDDVDQLTQMEFPAVSADFETEEVTDEDEFEEDDDWVAIFEEEEKLDSSTLDDWSNLETMQSTHPMFFAKRLVEVVSSPPLDGMDQPSACLAIEGLLRPVFVEEYPIIQKHLSDIQSSQDSGNPIGRPLEIDHENKINSTFTSNAIPDGPDKNDNLKVRTSFYKLEMSNIHLITSYGNQVTVNMNEFHESQPDVIALSAERIISRIKERGEKTSHAFKSLCWKHKGIKVDEATIVGVDSLGFDLRICSGIQVQTLRFAFSMQATSESCAEQRILDLLFPKITDGVKLITRNSDT